MTQFLLPSVISSNKWIKISWFWIPDENIYGGKRGSLNNINWFFSFGSFFGLFVNSIDQFTLQLQCMMHKHVHDNDNNLVSLSYFALSSILLELRGMLHIFFSKCLFTNYLLVHKILRCYLLHVACFAYISMHKMILWCFHFT